MQTCAPRSEAARTPATGSYATSPHEARSATHEPVPLLHRSEDMDGPSRRELPLDDGHRQPGAPDH